MNAFFAQSIFSLFLSVSYLKLNTFNPFKLGHWYFLQSWFYVQLIARVIFCSLLFSFVHSLTFYRNKIRTIEFLFAIVLCVFSKMLSLHVNVSFDYLLLKTTSIWILFEIPITTIFLNSYFSYYARVSSDYFMCNTKKSVLLSI